MSSAFMLKFKKIKLRNIKVFLKKLPRVVAQRAFLAFLILFSLSLTFSGLVYWRQSTLINEAQPESLGKQLKFRLKTYHDILTIWQQKEDRFDGANTKTYPNLFISK